MFSKKMTHDPRPAKTMRITAAAGWLILCFACIPTCVQAAESLQWSITPYLWASQTNVDLTLRGDPVGGDTISFKDLLDQLDTAFMIHAEAGRGNWSAFADLTYLETSNDRDRLVARGCRIVPERDRRYAVFRFRRSLPVEP
jgi:hypothetical protein